MGEGRNRESCEVTCAGATKSQSEKGKEEETAAQRTDLDVKGEKRIEKREREREREDEKSTNPYADVQ